MFDKIISFFKNKIVLLVLVVIIGIGSSYILGYDNAIEELSELFIKNTIQVEVDLSPNSKEVIIYDENR
jgi:uncharacterized membrane protein